MILSEQQIREAIRNSLMTELDRGAWASSLGQSRVSSLEFKCEFAEKLPENLRNFVRRAGNNFTEAFDETFPNADIFEKLTSDMGTVTNLVAELSYLASRYTYYIGMPCIAFYLGNLFLEKLTSFLVFIGLFDEAESVEDYVDKSAPKVNFDEAIAKKAASMAPSNLGQFKNNYPFYMFPLLSNSSDPLNASSPELQKLQRDLSNIETKIRKIRSLQTNNPKTAIRELESILGVQTNFKIDSGEMEQTALEDLKLACLTTLGGAYTKAAESFEHIPAYDYELKSFARRVF